MRLENGFRVPAAPDEVWRLLNDVPRVVPCMPGAELTGTVGEDAWKATLRVRLGPIGVSFLADVAREQRDDGARRVRLSARAREVKGKGVATATIESTVGEANGASDVTVVTELELTGAVARYGAAVFADVASDLTRRFAACLEAQLRPSAKSPPSPAPTTGGPIGVVGLLLRALRRRLARLLGLRQRGG